MRTPHASPVPIKKPKLASTSGLGPLSSPIPTSLLSPSLLLSPLSSRSSSRSTKPKLKLQHQQHIHLHTHHHHHHHHHPTNTSVGGGGGLGHHYHNHHHHVRSFRFVLLMISLLLTVFLSVSFTRLYNSMTLVVDQEQLLQQQQQKTLAIMSMTTTTPRPPTRRHPTPTMYHQNTNASKSSSSSSEVVGDYQTNITTTTTEAASATNETIATDAGNATSTTTQDDTTQETLDETQASQQQQQQQLDLSTASLRGKYGYTSPACTLQVDDHEDTFDEGMQSSSRNATFVPKTFNRIYVIHMRKAGGTSLRAYFRSVAKRWNVTVVVHEGKKSPELPGTDPNTLYVTHIRDPVARVISNYKYEMRWKCGEQLQQPGFVPTEQNIHMEFMTYITQDYQPKHEFWHCSQDCYSKWGTGFHKIYNEDLFSTDEEYRTLLDRRSRNVFSKYHLIIVNEWLKDPTYARSLEAIFGVERIDRKLGMQCNQLSIDANAANPLHIPEQQYQVIREKNSVDIGLYNDLTSCPNGPLFTNRKPLQFSVA